MKISEEKTTISVKPDTRDSLRLLCAMEMKTYDEIVRERFEKDFDKLKNIYYDNVLKHDDEIYDDEKLL